MPLITTSNTPLSPTVRAINDGKGAVTNVVYNVEISVPYPYVYASTNFPSSRTLRSVSE